jgi:hypothetical protein
MKRGVSIISYVTIGAMLSSCSTPVHLADDQLSQAHYQDWSCARLEEERHRLGMRAININAPTTVAEVAGLAAFMVVAPVVFPFILADVQVNGQSRPPDPEATRRYEERSRLLEAHDAIVKVSLQKDCEWARPLRCAPGQNEGPPHWCYAAPGATNK